jgi:hypothetical protein
MTSRDQLIESVARMMAAAYWRGKLEPHVDRQLVLEAMLKAAAEFDLPNWIASAKVACGDGIQFKPEAEPVA